jgi:hypothetical protein
MPGEPSVSARLFVSTVLTESDLPLEGDDCNFRIDKFRNSLGSVSFLSLLLSATASHPSDTTVYVYIYSIYIYSKPAFLCQDVACSQYQLQR